MEVAARLESKKKEKKETAAKSRAGRGGYGVRNVMKTNDTRMYDNVEVNLVTCSKWLGGPRAALAQGASGAAWSARKKCQDEAANV